MNLKFRVLKQVTVPQIKLGVNEEHFFKLESEIFQAKEMKSRQPQDPSKAMKQPPMLCRVLHLESGARGEIIVPAVLKLELEEAYPSASYVGRSFLIINKGKKAGKDYNTFEIAEIETDGEVDDQPQHKAVDEPIVNSVEDDQPAPVKKGKKAA